MSNFDGIAEGTNILAALSGLADGRVSTGLASNAAIPRDGFGNVSDYIVGKFSTPIATTTDRQLVASERSQPHVFAMTITGYSATSDGARDLAAAILNTLLGFSPNGSNATPLKATGGYAFTKLDASGAPVRYEQGVFLRTTINMAPDGS